MNISLSRTMAGILAAATVMTALPANAGDRWRDRHYHRPVVVERHNNGGELLAAGVLGLAAGALIAGAVNQPRPVYREPTYVPAPTYPDRTYYPPAPVYEQPRPIYQRPEPVYVRGAYEPWSSEWFRYCSDRYRSFDPDSGTFMGYDGIRRFCEAN